MFPLGYNKINAYDKNKLHFFLLILASFWDRFSQAIQYMF